MYLYKPFLISKLTNVLMARKPKRTQSGKVARAKRKPQTTWGKIWHFIWYEDSLASWAVNIVLAFVIIKFMVYPFLSLIFGTSLPVVAVISCSMDHGFVDCGANVPDNLCGTVGSGSTTPDEYWQACGDYYEAKGISQEAFFEFPLHNGFDKGDVIVLRGVEPEDVVVGDVLVFAAGRSHPIIHRVITVDDNDEGIFYETKGDHNPTQIVDSGLDETNISSTAVIGKGFFRIPYVGYVKIWAVDAIAFIIG